MRIVGFGLVATLGFAGIAAAADAPAPAAPVIALVRGTIVTVDAKSLTLKTDNGPVTAPLAPTTRYAAVEKRTFAQLKPTDFVGITSSPGKNGHLQAEEIHIIPVAGMGEGTYPWDHHPASHGPKRAGSMTNGTIAPPKKTAGSMTNGTLAKGDGAWQLKVSYRGSDMVDGKCVGHAPTTPTGGCVGSSIVDVTPSTAITAIVPAKFEDLKAGNQIFAVTITGPDGKTSWVSITTEKNGVKPEM
jgi:hypothetical protein